KQHTSISRDWSSYVCSSDLVSARQSTTPPTHNSFEYVYFSAKMNRLMLLADHYANLDTASCGHSPSTIGLSSLFFIHAPTLVSRDRMNAAYGLMILLQVSSF